MKNHYYNTTYINYSTAISNFESLGKPYCYVEKMYRTMDLKVTRCVRNKIFDEITKGK